MKFYILKNVDLVHPANMHDVYSYDFLFNCTMMGQDDTDLKLPSVDWCLMLVSVRFKALIMSLFIYCLSLLPLCVGFLCWVIVLWCDSRSPF